MAHSFNLKIKPVSEDLSVPLHHTQLQQLIVHIMFAVCLYCMLLG